MVSMGKLPYTPRAKKVIEYSIMEARNLMEDNRIGTEHLLLGLIREQEGIAAQVLMSFGLKLNLVRWEVLKLRCLPVLATIREDRVPPRRSLASAILAGDWSALRSWPTPWKRPALGLPVSPARCASGRSSRANGSSFECLAAAREATRPRSSSRCAQIKGPRGTAGMYERFTDRARKVMQLANQEAQRFNHEYVGTEHILLGLVKEGSGVAANVLKNLDIDLRKIRLEVEKIVQTGPDMVISSKLPHTPGAKKVITHSIEEARNLNHNYVGTEHLLLGLLRAQKRASPPRCS